MNTDEDPFGSHHRGRGVRGDRRFQQRVDVPRAAGRLPLPCLHHATKAPPFRIPPAAFTASSAARTPKAPPTNPPGHGSGYGAVGATGWGFGFGRPEVVVGGPVAVGVSAPAQGAPAYAPAVARKRRRNRATA